MTDYNSTYGKSYNSERDRQRAEDLYRQARRSAWLDGILSNVPELKEEARNLERKSWIDRRENDE